MGLIDSIKSGWRWTSLEPAAVIDQNAFGNVIVLDRDGGYWRICPEELSCKIVASDPESFERLRATSEFVVDWTVERLAAAARAKLGPPPDGSCYCLKIPAVLGGAYDAENFGTTTVGELLAASGDIARQINGLPDGSKVLFVIKD